MGNGNDLLTDPTSGTSIHAAVCWYVYTTQRANRSKEKKISQGHLEIEP